MLQILINNKPYDLPERPEEISLSQIVQFDQEFRKYKDWVEGVDVLKHIHPLRLMLNCISAFLDIESEELLDIPVGKFEEHIKDYSVKEINTACDTIDILFRNIVKASNYEPKLRTDHDYVFTHKGQEFTIPVIFRDAITGEAVNPKISTAEAIECLEIKRLTANYQGEEMKNVLFTEFLTLLAILSRKPGETFPEDETEINEFIEKRRIFFQDINMIPAYDTAFFLINTSQLSSRIRDIGISSSRPKK